MNFKCNLAKCSKIQLLICLFVNLFLSTSSVLAQSDPAQESADLQSAEPVGLADWPLLFKALNRPPAGEGRIVSFRELWEKEPAELDGPLTVSGLVLRRFRREAVGQFPPLAELWVRTDDDGLILLTVRQDDQKDDSKKWLAEATEPGRMIEAQAYFLRRVRYTAEDTQRIAPWLVAAKINNNGTGDAGATAPGSSGESASWMLVIWATVASAAVLRVLINLVNRPRRKDLRA